MFSIWYARRDLNPRPSGSKPDALSTELRAHERVRFIVPVLSSILSDYGSIYMPKSKE